MKMKNSTSEHMNVAKAVPREKFIALSFYIKEKK